MKNPLSQRRLNPNGFGSDNFFMKIIAISGSSRDKKTNMMIELALKEQSNFEIIKLKDLEIKPCTNCKSCHQTYKCVINDQMQDLYPKLVEADLIILASPTYFDNVSGIMKNFMDRCLPFYFSGQLAQEKVALLTIGGFKEYIEYDDLGNCKWCLENNACQNSVDQCMQTMENFCRLLNLSIIGKVSAIHGDPLEKEKELKELGEKINVFRPAKKKK